MIPKNPEPKPISDALRVARLKYGFTQSDIAKSLGICRSTYTYYETGKTKPDIKTLQKLAVLYSLTIDELLNAEISMQEHFRSRPKKKIAHTIEEITGLTGEERSIVAHLRSKGNKYTLRLLSALQNSE